MSVRSYTRIWIHIVWATYRRRKSLYPADLRRNISRHITDYSKQNCFNMIINYVNIDHVHALINLPTNLSLEKIMQRLKGESSRWISLQFDREFSWGKGYGAFSVSESDVQWVWKYIRDQETHHEKQLFEDEHGELVKHLITLDEN